MNSADKKVKMYACKKATNNSRILNKVEPTTAMIAVGCQQYRICNTGKCPVGIATQDPILRARLNIASSAKWLENFLRASTEELQDFSRLTGKSDVHQLSLKDLCTTNSEVSGYTDIEHV